MDHPFRSATFGGFNRQDVLTYLSSTAQEAAQRQQELQQQLEEAGDAVAKRGAALVDLQRQVDTLQDERKELCAQLDRVNAELTASRSREERLEQQLAQSRREAESLKEQAHQEMEELRKQSRQEKEALQARLTLLEPDAQAYTAIKDRTAGIELAAHRRAQAIQVQAEEEANQLRRQMAQWMGKLEQEYGVLRGEVQMSVSRATEQLLQAEQDLAQVTALLDAQKLELESAVQAASAPDEDTLAAILDKKA
ncbi:MAG: hypothetical protein HFF50_01745 [Lawsonibacter sp.]|nr:hypothetical protein [Lawsonibacter sp.]